jgi:hypothetical protein
VAQASRALWSYERMSKHDAARQESDGIDGKTMTVPVAGGTLFYRVEREQRRTGTHIVAQTLVDVDVEDPERLRPVLNELGHESAHVTHDGVER